MENAHAVLSIVEILENILCHVDQKTLLISGQRVCRHWHDVIATSPPIQKHLFFRPDVHRKNKELNPMLNSIFPHWFRAKYPDWFKAYLDMYGLPHHEIVDRVHMPAPIDRGPRRKIPIRLDDPDFPTRWFRIPPMPSFWDPILQVENASWRRMLVQQPPVTELVTYSLPEAPIWQQQGIDGPYWGVGEYPPGQPDTSNGVLISHLVECNRNGAKDSYWPEWITMPKVLWDSEDHHVPEGFCWIDLEAEHRIMLQDALAKYGMIVVKVRPSSHYKRTYWSAEFGRYRATYYG
ncbi:uncharacterized protein N7506_003101 [Penicillium brevicompactum]|uniref:uncharacterized protein n=1 Tax=Penicillium brevicompactum TaxID=5074 RepID=UPI002541887B|nr:uncharacterized protein N7506_003101 [Penicillium brevicompactum]KAJ5343277.1 hypothetical protein N7506_003101 [Penicillium brevicompactum]